MKSLLFVEDFDKDSFDKIVKDSSLLCVVGLTPEACDNMYKAEISYGIPEDYFVWQERRLYSEWFQKWMNELSIFVSGYYQNFRTWHCVSMLKNVIDAFVRRATQWKVIMDKEKPEKIFYMKKIGLKGERIDEELYFKGGSLYSRLFAATDKKNVDKKWILFGKGKNRVKETNNWRDNKKIRNTYDWFRCFRFIPAYGGKKKILLSASIPNLERKLRLKGAYIKLAPELSWNVIFFNHSLTDNFFESISQQIGIDSIICKKILEKRLAFFTNIIVPLIINFAERYDSFFKKNKFDLVIFPRRNHLYQYGLLIAAKRAGIETAYIRHGWDAYDNWVRYYTRFEPYDLFITGTELDKEFYSNKGWGKVI